MKKNNNKQKNPGWNFALILVSLQHFKPRRRFLLFLPSSSIACISISVAHWNFALILLSLQHFKPISHFLLCLEAVFSLPPEFLHRLHLNLCSFLEFCPNFGLSSTFQAQKPFSSLPPEHLHHLHFNLCGSFIFSRIRLSRKFE